MASDAIRSIEMTQVHHVARRRISMGNLFRAGCYHPSLHGQTDDGSKSSGTGTPSGTETKPNDRLVEAESAKARRPSKDTTKRSVADDANDLAFGLIFGLMLVPAAFMVSGNKFAVGATLIAIALVVAASQLELRDSLVDKYLDSVAWLIAGLTLSTVVARAIFAPGRVNYHRVTGGVLLYLSIGLIFVALFGFVALLVPNAFNNVAPVQGNFGIGNLIYFSFVTLTTIGYGDVVPLHHYARGLANVEAIIGQLYPATLLARLVTLELGSR